MLQTMQALYTIYKADRDKKKKGKKRKEEGINILINELPT